MKKTPKIVSAWMKTLGKKGGRARAEKMTPERRRETASKAAMVRWGDTKKNKS